MGSSLLVFFQVWIFLGLLVGFSASNVAMMAAVIDVYYLIVILVFLETPRHQLGRKDYRRALIFTPVVLPFVLLFFSLWKGIQAIHEVNAGKLLRTCLRFLWHLVILIHSRERTICMTYSAVCVMVSFFFFSQTLLGIAGGVSVGTILGLVDYKLVRTYWPGLIPESN